MNGQPVSGPGIFEDSRDIGGGWTLVFGRTPAIKPIGHNQRIANLRLPGPVSQWTAQTTFHSTDSVGSPMVAFEMAPSINGADHVIVVKAVQGAGNNTEDTYFCDYSVICKLVKNMK